MGGIQTIDVRLDAAHAGWRLDRALAAAVPTLSRERMKALIKSGAVVSGGTEIRDPALKVQGEEALRIAVPEPRPAHNEPQHIPLNIVFEDDHLLVVDKPAGLVVHPSAGHRSGTLVHGLRALDAEGGDEDRPGIVHRLDRDTSGLLVVARSELAHARLQRALQRREIEREYLALVIGRPPARSGTIEAPIGRDPHVRTRMAVGGAHPREARTHFELDRALPEHSLLRLKLETGRTHQIRVHLQAIGHPVAGDPEYGGRGALGLQRQFLHAARLAFAHPLSGDPIDVSSPLPADLREALACAERLS